MSMHDLLVDAVERHRLFLVEPRMPSEPMNRDLYVTPEFHRLITGPWEDEEQHLAGRLWAAFDRFVVGQRISMALNNPYEKPSHTYMSRLDPTGDEVWEIRIRDPKPALRVFGRFAAKDCFVALNWAPRKDLGGPGSGEFQREIRTCLARWRQIFPHHNALTGNTVNEYISEHAFPV